MAAARFGELLALASSVFWAVAIILFRISGRKVAPLGLNLFKNVLGFLLFLLTMALAGQTLLRHAPWHEYALLMTSGLLGMAVSDTLFFQSLNLLGAGQASIISSTYSPFIISLSLAVLGERLNVRQAVGAAVIVLAIVLLGYQKREKSLPRGALFWGILWGALAQLSTAVSIVLIKPVLGRVPLLWATTVRLAGSIPALVLIVALVRGRRAILGPLGDLKNWKVMVPAAVLGSYCSIFIWMGSLKYAQASVVAVLVQINIALAFVLGAVFLKERVTPVKAVAVFLALLGALLTSSL